MRNCRGALLTTLCVLLQTPCFADEEPSASSSSSSASSSSSYFRGYGGTRANVFAPRYKERLANFAAQIDNGAAKGWLTSAEAETFRNQVFALTALEKEVSEKGYPKDELDDMEKRFNELNVRLSQTMSKGTPPPPATTAGGADATPGAEPASSTKPADTPAAKTAAKAAASTSEAKTKAKTTAKKPASKPKAQSKKKFKRP